MFSLILVVVFAALCSTSHATSFLPYLNFTSPSPYIFHSLSTLLQTKPQTLFPNGHTIVATTIPQGTLLYHGRHDNDTVPSPEWLAMDIEMAYGIMGNLPDSRMLTYRTTKDVQLVYFDGTSANLMGEGTKSQMVLLYNGTEGIPQRGGRPRPPRRGHGGAGADETGWEKEDEEKPPRGPPGRWNPLEDEYFRARGLCDWLSTYGLRDEGSGYEGVVRMNAGFEVIWCNFKSPSLKLISNLNVSAPLLEEAADGWQQPQTFELLNRQAQARLRTSEDEGPHGPGMTDPREPFRDFSTWFWFTAAAQRYYSESRIKLNACGLFSFYDPQVRNHSIHRAEEERKRLNLTAGGQWVAPSEEVSRLVGLDKLTKRRRQHTLSTVTKKDAMAMFLSLRRKLSIAQGGCTAVDWAYVAQEVVTRYSGKIQNLQRMLSNSIPEPADDWTTLKAWLRSTRGLTHWFLLPFLEYPPDRPYDKEVLADLFSLDSPAAKSALERCQTQYESDSHIPHEGEAVYAAINETLLAICSSVISVGLDVEYHWLSDFNGKIPSNEVQSVVGKALLTAAKAWQFKVEELMAWLGWVDQWTTCEKPCGTGEICYLPMWPVSGFSPRHRPPPPGREHRLAPPDFEWGDSILLWEPVCVNASNYPPEQWDSAT